MNRGFFWIWFFLSSGNMLAQQFHFERYNYEQGLTSSQVLSVDQDMYGHMWMMTFSSDVVYQFDGRRFTQHVIPGLPSSDNFKIIRCGSNEKIYLLTSKYFFEYDGKATNRNTLPNSFLAANDAVFFLDKENRAWIIGRDGRVFFGGIKGFSEVTGVLNMQSRALAIFEQNEKVTIVSESGELRVYDGVKGFSEIRNLNGLSDHTKIDFVSASQKYFFFGMRRSIHWFDGEKKESVIDLGDALGSISKIEVDTEGGIWILLHTKNYNKSFVYHFKNGKTTFITGINGFTQAFVIDLFQDELGTIWFLTDGDGLIQLRKPSVVSLCAAEMLPTRTMTIDGSLYVGTYRKGIYEIIDGKPLRRKEFNLLDGKSIVDIDTVKNHILFSTGENCFYAFDRGIKTTKRIEFEGPAVRTIEPVGDSLILGTSNGIFVYYRNKFSPVYSPKGGILVVSQVMRAGPGRYLVATQNAGLYTWLNGDQLTKVDSIQATFISSIRTDSQGRIWISGDNQELWSMNSTFRDLRKVDLDPSMDRFISNIEFVNDSTLLMGGMTTLYRIGLRGSTVTQVKRFAKADGFVGGDFFVNSFRINRDNTIDILAGSAKRYYPERDHDRSPQPAFLKQVAITDQKGSVLPISGHGFYNTPEHIELSRTWNNLVFDFGMKGLRDASPWYQYLLEGNEESWSAPSESDRVIFRHLPPGQYTFRVRATLNRREWGKEAVMHFEILPAFWETKFFIILVSFVALMLIVFLVRLLSFRKLNRYKQLLAIRAEERERIRKQMAMDFHDEMGNKLASMLAYSELMKSRGFERMETAQLEYFSGIISEVYSGTRDFIWSIDIRSNSLCEILSYLRDYGSLYFEKHKIRFLVKSDILGPDYDHQLPEGNNRQIVLIFKEAMTNIVKHAGADTVVFDAKNVGNEYIISISDNGKGIAADLATGMGLANMRKRAAAINAQLTLTTSQGQGVYISLIIQI
ncbi:MAG TPA: triple tyrosine motif-containing protein [Cyclobacteriaceae bacterium]|nr:triple tyrosine motif-containing protein [Cyclobacteriaceae bacterium]